MQDDNAKVDNLNQSAFSYIYADISLAEKMTIEAASLAAEVNYTKGIAWALLNRGLLEIEAGLYEIAAEKLYQANHIFQDMKNETRGLTASENALGLLCIRQGKIREAFTHLHKAMTASELMGYKDLQFSNINYFGILQYKTDNFNQALRFFRKAIELNTDNKITALLNNLGCTYRALKKYDLSLDYLNRALKQAELEGKKDTRIPILEELGLTYGELEQYEKGIEYLLLALSECTEYHNRYKLQLYIDLGDLYLKTEELPAAESMLSKAKTLITDSNAISHRNLYLLLSQLSEYKGESDQALKYYKKYHELSGKVKSAEVDEKIWQMETEQLKKLNSRITTISELGKKLTAKLEKQEVIQTLLHSLNSLFPVDYCIIGQWNKKELTLDTKVFNRSQNAISELLINPEIPDNIISWVYLHKAGLLLNNFKTEYSSFFTTMDNGLFPEEISSTICLPYETSENRGVIGIFSHRENSFNSEDREFLEMLTSFAAIALTNSIRTETINSYNRELENINRFDSLTGIYNRRHFLKSMQESWDSGCRNKSFFHFMLIDLDLFKNINDTWGHEAGDICLYSVSRIFETLLQRSVEGYGRYGGEEFVVYMQGMKPGGAEEMAERIRSTIEKTPVMFEEKQIYITASIGLVSLQLDCSTDLTIQDLISKADKNMYKSKMDGRNKITSSQI